MTKANNPCTYIDGIGSSQAIDTAGEIVDLKGLDISSLVGAAFNWEHNKDLPAQIVGKILEAKKIFSKEDCENDRQLFYWEKCQIPFLYVMGRLFDDRKPSSVEVAALFKDDAAHPNEADMVGFSIEGAKVEKIGAVVTRSIARKCTITHIPANKTCIAEMLPVVKEKKNDIDSLFKGEMELFKFEPTYQEIMQKKESDINNLSKAMEAGSGMAAPSQLTQGAAIAKEHTLEGDTTIEGPERKKRVIGIGMMGTGMGAMGGLGGGMGKSLAKKEKSKHFERADEAYKNWGDREKFRGYMKKRMPHLADGEIDAFGRVLALKKDMDKESKLSKMYSSYFGKKESLEKAVSTSVGRDLETGHEKGVHTQSPSQKPGVSAMGQQVRHAKALSDKGKGGYGGHYKANFTAKMHAESKIKESSSMPSPSLKSEDVKKTSDIMMVSEDKSNKKQ